MHTAWNSLCKEEHSYSEPRVLRYVMQNRTRKYILFPFTFDCNFNLNSVQWLWNGFNIMIRWGFIGINCLIWKCFRRENEALMQHLIAMMRSGMRHLHHSQHSISNCSFRIFIEIHKAIATYTIIWVCQMFIQRKQKSILLKQVQTFLRSQTQFIYIFLAHSFFM